MWTPFDADDGRDGSGGCDHGEEIDVGGIDGTATKRGTALATKIQVNIKSFIPLLQLCYFHRQCQQCMKPVFPAYLPVGKCRPVSLGSPPTCLPHLCHGAPQTLTYMYEITMST